MVRCPARPSKAAFGGHLRMTESGAIRFALPPRRFDKTATADQSPPTSASFFALLHPLTRLSSRNGVGYPTEML